MHICPAGTEKAGQGVGRSGPDCKFDCGKNISKKCKRKPWKCNGGKRS